MTWVWSSILAVVVYESVWGSLTQHTNFLQVLWNPPILMTHLMQTSAENYIKDPIELLWVTLEFTIKAKLNFYNLSLPSKCTILAKKNWYLPLIPTLWLTVRVLFQLFSLSVPAIFYISYHFLLFSLSVQFQIFSLLVQFLLFDLFEHNSESLPYFPPENTTSTSTFQ